MSLKIRFRINGSVSAIPVTTRNAMDGHAMGTARDVNLCTSFTFTRTLHRRKLTV